MIVCDRFGVIDCAVDVTVDDVDHGGLFGVLGCGDMVRGVGIVSGVYGYVSGGSWCVEYVEGRFQQV